MERDPLERTIVVKPMKKPQGDATAPRLEQVKKEPAQKTPEETQRALATLASLYRLFRG